MKTTMRCSGLKPLVVMPCTRCTRNCFFTFPLLPNDQRTSTNTKSSVLGVVLFGYVGSNRKSVKSSSRTRWNLSVAGTPTSTSASWTRSSTIANNWSLTPIVSKPAPPIAVQRAAICNSNACFWCISSAMLKGLGAAGRFAFAPPCRMAKHPDTSHRLHDKARFEGLRNAQLGTSLACSQRA